MSSQPSSTPSAPDSALPDSVPVNSPLTPGPSTIPATTHSTPSLPNSPTEELEFLEGPLDDLLECKMNGKLVHQMNPEELAVFIKRCAVLRSSAQTRKAAIQAEAGVQKKKASPKKDNVSLADALLKQFLGK